jgi:hypothetical protein
MPHTPLSAVNYLQNGVFFGRAVGDQKDGPLV